LLDQPQQIALLALKLSGVGFLPEVVGIRHSRESGNPAARRKELHSNLDARLRGHDGEMPSAAVE
jgi:hypothetical protein